MKKYIAQGAGFRGDNDFLMFIQEIIKEVGQLASLGGDTYILKGCVDTGGNVSGGWMVLAGEIIPFIGGALGTEVTIIEAIENVAYLEDIAPVDGVGDSKQAYFTRHAEFGNGGEATYNWADIEKSPFAEIQRRLPPSECPQMYFGNVNSIKEGWQLCDGTNGTPDLSGQFIVGYDPNDTDYNDIGKQGGSKGVGLTANQNGPHAHTGNITIPSHTHPTTGYLKQPQSVDNGGGAVVADSLGSSPNTGSAGGGTHGFNTNNSGVGQQHENRPNYYTLAYIVYVGV